MPRFRPVAPALASALAILPPAAPAQCGPRGLDRPTPRPDLLVSTAWLADHLDDAALVVLHVGGASGADGYAAGHVPGARLVDPMTWTVGDHDLPPAPALAARVAALGVANDSRVVLYGDPWHAGWVYFALASVGHGDRTALLDGGLAQWRAEGRPVATGPAAAVAPGRFRPAPRPDAAADAAWIHERLCRQRLVVIDGRSAEEYAGTARENLPRTGHIPGARHLDWSRTFTDPAGAVEGRSSRLVPLAQLQRLFADAGAGSGSEVVLYCTVGLRASHLYFIARYLGYEPRMYDGSWADWSRRAELPVATGAAPEETR